MNLLSNSWPTTALAHATCHVGMRVFEPVKGTMGECCRDPWSHPAPCRRLELLQERIIHAGRLCIAVLHADTQSGRKPAAKADWANCVAPWSCGLIGAELQLLRNLRRMSVRSAAAYMRAPGLTNCLRRWRQQTAKCQHTPLDTKKSGHAFCQYLARLPQKVLVGRVLS